MDITKIKMITSVKQKGNELILGTDDPQIKLIVETFTNQIFKISIRNTTGNAENLNLGFSETGTFLGVGNEKIFWRTIYKIQIQ